MEATERNAQTQKESSEVAAVRHWETQNPLSTKCRRLKRALAAAEQIITNLLVPPETSSVITAIKLEYSVCVCEQKEGRARTSATWQAAASHKVCDY